MTCFLCENLKLMKKTQLFRFLTIGMLALGVVSCKKDDAPPANQIEDASGIQTTLTWTMNDGSAPDQGADLDIALYKGTGANKVATTYFSDGFTATETFNVISSLADGDYTIAVQYYNIQATGGKMNFSFDGMTANKKFEIKGIAFVQADNDNEKDLVKISKSGNKFTITKL